MEKLVQQIIGQTPGNFLNWPNNWVLKLVSLLFAVLLWYFVVGEDKVDTTIYVPVEIVNLPRELVIANQFRRQIEVTISGPRGLISGINRQHISRTINLSKATPGTMVVRNDPETMPFPRGITVLRLQPTHVTLLIDRLVEKDLPIQAKTEGEPAEGYELAEILFEPPFIRLAGPQGILEPTKTLHSKVIDLSGLKAPVTAQVTLDLKPEILELIGETVVTAHVVVQEKSTEKTLSGIPVRLLNPLLQKRLTEMRPKSVEVRFLLPRSKAAADLAAQITAQVRAEDLPAGSHRLPVEILAPEHVTVLEVTPKNVTVEIGKLPRQ
jgi:YbbR domain-containing protein